MAVASVQQGQGIGANGLACPQSHPVPQNTFIFRLEGTGALPLEEVVLMALDILSNKLQTLVAELDREAHELAEDTML